MTARAGRVATSAGQTASARASTAFATSPSARPRAPVPSAVGHRFGQLNVRWNGDDASASAGQVIQLKPILILDKETGRLKRVESDNYTPGQLRAFHDDLNPADALHARPRAELGRLIARMRAPKRKRSARSEKGWELAPSAEEARQTARRRAGATEQTFLDPARGKGHLELSRKLLAGLKSSTRPSDIDYEGVTAQQGIKAQLAAISASLAEQGENFDTVTSFPWGAPSSKDASKRSGIANQYIKRGSGTFHQKRLPSPSNVTNVFASSFGDYGSRPEPTGKLYSLDIIREAQTQLGFGTEQDVARAMLDFGRTGASFAATPSYSRPASSPPVVPPWVPPASTTTTTTSSSLPPLRPSRSSSSLPIPSPHPMLSSSSRTSSSPGLLTHVPPIVPSLPVPTSTPTSVPTSSTSTIAPATSPELESIALRFNALTHHYDLEEPTRFQGRGAENPKRVKGRTPLTNDQRRKPAQVGNTWGMQAVASGLTPMADVLGKGAPKGPVTPKGVASNPELFEKRFLAVFDDRQKLAAKDPDILHNLLGGDSTLTPRLTPTRQAIRLDLHRAGGGESDLEDDTGYETDVDRGTGEEEEEEDEGGSIRMDSGDRSSETGKDIEEEEETS